jgi:hypothetical protein
MMNFLLNNECDFDLDNSEITNSFNPIYTALINDFIKKIKNKNTNYESPTLSSQYRFLVQDKERIIETSLQGEEDEDGNYYILKCYCYVNIKTLTVYNVEVSEEYCD